MKEIFFLTHICLILTGIFISLGANAEMYKWVDEDGNTHYSQSPPVDNGTVEVIKPPSKVDTKSAIKELKEQEKTADKLRDDRISAKEKERKAEEEDLAKQKKCEQAKKRLASYQRPRVQVKNEDGSRSLLPEEERQAEIKKSQAYVDEVCN